jgi:hypothetical protein
VVNSLVRNVGAICVLKEAAVLLVNMLVVYNYASSDKIVCTQ